MSKEEVNNYNRARWHQARELVKTNGDFLCYLWSRWQDEREYEDFEEYKNAIDKHFYPFICYKHTKRPFGFSILVGKELGMKVKVTGKGISVEKVGTGEGGGL